MERVDFIILGLQGQGNAQDLSNALVGISGVSAVLSDEGSQTLSVEYDPVFTSREMVKSSIEASGYPIEEIKEVGR